MVRHCYWKNDEEIIAFENKHGSGPGYYLMKDKTREYKHLWKELCVDGHPSYSPDGKLVVTDSYPDRTRIVSVRIMRSRDGTKICFDAAFEGHRRLYVVDIKA